MNFNAFVSIANYPLVPGIKKKESKKTTIVYISIAITTNRKKRNYDCFEGISIYIAISTRIKRKKSNCFVES